MKILLSVIIILLVAGSLGRPIMKVNWRPHVTGDEDPESFGADEPPAAAHPPLADPESFGAVEPPAAAHPPLADPESFGAYEPPAVAHPPLADPESFGAVEPPAVPHPPLADLKSFGADEPPAVPHPPLEDPESFGADELPAAAHPPLADPESFGAVEPPTAAYPPLADPESFSAGETPAAAHPPLADPKSFGAGEPPAAAHPPLADPKSFGADDTPAAALPPLADPESFGADEPPAAAHPPLADPESFGAGEPPAAALPPLADPESFGADDTPAAALPPLADPESFGAGEPPAAAHPPLADSDLSPNRDGNDKNFDIQTDKSLKSLPKAKILANIIRRSRRSPEPELENDQLLLMTRKVRASLNHHPRKRNFDNKLIPEVDNLQLLNIKNGFPTVRNSYDEDSTQVDVDAAALHHLAELWTGDGLPGTHSSKKRNGVNLDANLELNVNRQDGKYYPVEQNQDGQSYTVEQNQDGQSYTVQQNQDGQSYTVEQNQDGQSYTVQQNQDGQSYTVEQNQDGQSYTVQQNQDGQSYTVEQNQDGQYYPVEQNQDGQYYPVQQNQDGQYYPEQQNQDGQYYPVQQNQDGQYYPVQQNHDGQYYPVQQNQDGQSYPVQQNQDGQYYPMGRNQGDWSQQDYQHHPHKMPMFSQHQASPTKSKTAPSDELKKLEEVENEETDLKVIDVPPQSDKSSKNNEQTPSDVSPQSDKTSKNNEQTPSDVSPQSDKTSKNNEQTASDVSPQSDKTSKNNEPAPSDEPTASDVSPQSDKTSKNNEPNPSDEHTASDKTSKTEEPTPSDELKKLNKNYKKHIKLRHRKKNMHKDSLKKLDEVENEETDLKSVQDERTQIDEPAPSYEGNQSDEPENDKTSQSNELPPSDELKKPNKNYKKHIKLRHRKKNIYKDSLKKLDEVENEETDLKSVQDERTQIDEPIPSHELKKLNKNYKAQKLENIIRRSRRSPKPELENDQLLMTKKVRASLNHHMHKRNFDFYNELIPEVDNLQLLNIKNGLSTVQNSYDEDSTQVDVDDAALHRLAELRTGDGLPGIHSGKKRIDVNLDANLELNVNQQDGQYYSVQQNQDGQSEEPSQIDETSLSDEAASSDEPANGEPTPSDELNKPNKNYKKHIKLRHRKTNMYKDSLKKLDEVENEETDLKIVQDERTQIDEPSPSDELNKPNKNYKKHINLKNRKKNMYKDSLKKLDEVENEETDLKIVQDEQTQIDEPALSYEGNQSDEPENDKTSQSNELPPSDELKKPNKNYKKHIKLKNRKKNIYKDSLKKLDEVENEETDLKIVQDERTQIEEPIPSDELNKQNKNDKKHIKLKNRKKNMYKDSLKTLEEVESEETDLKTVDDKRTQIEEPTPSDELKKLNKNYTKHIKLTHRKKNMHKDSVETLEEVENEETDLKTVDDKRTQIDEPSPSDELKKLNNNYKKLEEVENEMRNLKIVQNRKNYSLEEEPELK